MALQTKTLLGLAGASLLCATIAGALASHVLNGLDADELRSFSTAVDFQFFHALGLIAVVLVAERGLGAPLLWPAAWLLVAGIVLFCGSIYAVTLGAPRELVAAAPYGGVALMFGWVLFVAGVVRARPR
jgi:uncharacterized membrane protein YgdD (TMEM256/DUF423 family)